MSGAALRDGALNDNTVIQTINDGFAPVWINVRTDPLPPLPDQEDIRHAARFSEAGDVEDLFSKGFFLRILVLAPDDLRLLNPQATTASGSVQTFSDEGHFAYAQVDSDDVLSVLRAAQEEWSAP